MKIALYDPDAGYYRSEKPRIGRDGDFYTSSHLHSAFGSMIGKQVEEMWELMDRPGDFSLVELGAGEGYVCLDLMKSLSGRDFYQALKYSIIERSPAVSVRQKQLLEGFQDKVTWLSSLSEAGDIRGCIFSNELIDAFPVHLVQMEDELKEVWVDVDSGGLKEVLLPPSTRDLADYLKEFPSVWQRGYRTEVNLGIRDWLRDVNDRLKQGFILTIDYGYTGRDYYSEERDRGTLMCYFRHQLSENPLENIGEQDITAHVNFSSLRKWGEALGLKTTGFCSQGAFLVSLGIDDEVKRLSPDSADFPFELARIKKLILPQGMGESHMVLAQNKGLESPRLRGFSISNRMRHL
ncbi:MAG: SAM-dependent methyltransferase [Nitrospirae bacterium]|nr:SAM-dependent methyltransferase [Nitrospirota bacterium]